MHCGMLTVLRVCAALERSMRNWAGAIYEKK